MRGDKIRGMLCLEMVGYYSTVDNSQTVPPLIPKWMRRFFPHRGDFLAAVGNMPSWKLCWNFRRGFKRGARSSQLAKEMIDLRRGNIEHKRYWSEHLHPAPNKNTESRFDFYDMSQGLL